MLRTDGEIDEIEDSPSEIGILMALLALDEACPGLRDVTYTLNMRLVACFTIDDDERPQHV